MNFQEAFDQAFELEKKRSEAKGETFVITPGTAKILTFFWNMLKVSDFELDNFVGIDDNNNIIVISEQKSLSTAPKEKKGKKAVKDNGEKEKEKPESADSKPTE